MFVKRLHSIFTLLIAVLFASLTTYAGNDLGKIVSFDDEEVEVRVDGEIDYWPIEKLGKPPITILEKDSSNFVRIKLDGKGDVWVSLSYVTTDQQVAMKKNCQSQQIAQSGNKKQFGVRGIGESCE